MNEETAQSYVSIQLISLTSREGYYKKVIHKENDNFVSIQLISLTSREITNWKAQKTNPLRFHSINFPNE